MSQIVVIGPVKGLHLLGYYVESSSKFYVIQEFVSEELANLTAWRMNSNRAKGIV